MTLVEICVDDVAGARTAEACGADRVELCADLLEGGITPSIGMVGTTLATVRRVGVQVLIRPRGGSFTYDADEVAAMLADIAAVRRLPTTVRVGFVVNALTPDRQVDEDVTRELVTACGGSPVTFSRAFDEVPDQYAALDVLARLGVHKVLTAGGPGPAADHHDSLRDLVRHARNRLTLLAAGGVRSGNVAALLERTGVSEVHLRASSSTPHGTTSHGPTSDGTTHHGTSPDEVRAVLAAVGRMDP